MVIIFKVPMLLDMVKNKMMTYYIIIQLLKSLVTVISF